MAWTIFSKPTINPTGSFWWGFLLPCAYPTSPIPFTHGRSLSGHSGGKAAAARRQWGGGNDGKGASAKLLQLLGAMFTAIVQNDLIP
jgi:hypothetical protein